MRKVPKVDIPKVPNMVVPITKKDKGEGEANTDHSLRSVVGGFSL